MREYSVADIHELVHSRRNSSHLSRQPIATVLTNKKKNTKITGKKLTLRQIYKKNV